MRNDEMTKMKKYFYAALCVIGTVLPYTQFIPWVLENGLDVSLLVGQIASSRLAAFGWLDVIVSAPALFVLVFSEGRKDRVPFFWLPIVGTLTVGVSLGLPLYLFLREVGRERVA
jgi:hypothetical protein